MGSAICVACVSRRWWKLQKKSASVSAPPWESHGAQMVVDLQMLADHSPVTDVLCLLYILRDTFPVAVAGDGLKVSKS